MFQRQGRSRGRCLLLLRRCRQRRFASLLASLLASLVIDLDVPDGNDPAEHPRVERRERFGVEVSPRGGRGAMQMLGGLGFDVHSGVSLRQV